MDSVPNYLIGIGIVSLTVTCSIAGLLLVRRLVPLDVLQSNHEVAGAKFQVMGTLYAVLLAFAVVIVWQQFQAAGTTVVLESAKIADLFRDAAEYPESDRVRYGNHPGVSCLGHVPDIRPHVAEACCCVVPIRVGGGTRLKILDAWAMGKPVVSTSIGCEGLSAIEGENILIRDTPISFADAVLKVLSDSKLRSQLGENGRRTAEQLYSWDVVGRDMCTYYCRQLQGS